MRAAVAPLSHDRLAWRARDRAWMVASLAEMDHRRCRRGDLWLQLPQRLVTEVTGLGRTNAPSSKRTMYRSSTERSGM